MIPIGTQPEGGIPKVNLPGKPTPKPKAQPKIQLVVTEDFDFDNSVL